MNANDEEQSIITEQSFKNDEGFAGNLGLTMNQEQHYMTSDVDNNGVVIG